MFEHFEPQVIHEVQNARSCISISFDGWGSKYKKISVIGVVIHFINDKYENVTRLIGLPELPGHGKAGVGKWSFLLIYRACRYTLFISGVLLMNSVICLLRHR